tara:strand:+ start:817 stop:2031 length:1215 start_codon:yes stop_codon:yes gene_type:complete
MIFIAKLKLQLIFFVALLTRLFALYYYRDIEVSNEWGIMLMNLEEYNILSVHSVQGIPVPNIFMPPLYPIFLYCIKLFITNKDIFLWVIQFIQLIFALVSIYLSFRILSEFFSKNISYIGTLIFTLFPLNIYAVSQISSVTMQILLFNLFLFSFLKLFKNLRIKHIFLFSISAGLLMLLRGEFFLFVLLSIFYLFLKRKNLSKIILICLICLLTISPYLYRNYNIFGVITITKSGGYNLLKGNHPRTKVEGTPMFLNIENVIPEVKEDLQKLILKGPTQDYDLAQDKILLNQAIKFIKDDPFRYIELYFKKLFSFALVDLNAKYNNYYSPLHIIPKIILGLTTIVGVILSFKLKISALNYITLYYFGNLGLFSIFFILPRYSLSLLIIQVILSLIILKKIKPNL